MENGVAESVKTYYGKELQSKDDLKTSACCPMEALSQNLKIVTGKLHPEILERSYGCGSPIPESLEGLTVLDLGCGTGRDCYVLSQLVGESGRVIGVDMTEEQLAVARSHLDYHREQFGYKKSNVEFHMGYIEDLAALGIEDNSVDLVISNCVINLSADKQKVFSEIFRVLKPGGELYFSDVFADRRLPKELLKDQELLGECLAGAMYTEDFRRMLAELGCPDYRSVSSAPIEIEKETLRNRIGLCQFVSVTVRAFKLASLEDRCEDFGQVATYNGSIDEHPHLFSLDDHHFFEKGKPMLVCGNTAAMLEETRFKRHFTVQGDRSTHFGLFDYDAPVFTEGPAVSCC